MNCSYIVVCTLYHCHYKLNDILRWICLVYDRLHLIQLSEEGQGAGSRIRQPSEFAAVHNPKAGVEPFTMRSQR